jgi:hypothetical protein
MSDDSPSVYVREDGKIVYRASDIGGCVTRLAASRQGQQKTEPKEFVQMVFDRGNEVEDKFFARCPELAHYRQLEVVLEITGKISVVGHLDAYAEDHLIEVKRQATKEWEKWTWDSWTDDPLWVKYSWQISACMLGLGWGKDPFNLPAWVFRVNGDDGREACVEVKEPFWSKEDIRARVLEVEALAHEDKLVCVTPDFFCQYQYLHQDDKEIVDDDELERLVDEYQQAKIVMDAGGVRMSAARAGIVERMGEKGWGKVLLMSGRSVSKSEFDTKDHVVKGSHQVRVTVK